MIPGISALLSGIVASAINVGGEVPEPGVAVLMGRFEHALSESDDASGVDYLKPVSRIPTGGPFGGPFARFATGTTATSQGFLPQSARAAFDFQTSDFTMEMWVRRGSAPAADETVASAWLSNLVYDCWRWGFTTTGIRFQYRDTGGTARTYTTPFPTSPSLWDGEWHHLAVVRSGSTLTHFVDGIAQTSFTMPNSIRPVSNTAPARFIIGGQSNGSPLGVNSFLGGDLTEVRITVGVARYSATFTPPASVFPRGSGDPDWDDVTFLLGLTSFSDTSFECGDVTHEDFSWPQVAQTSGRGVINDFGLACRGLSSGNTQRVTIPAPEELDLGSGNFTIEAWMARPTSLSGAAPGPLLGFEGAGNRSWGLQDVSGSGGGLELQLSADGTATTQTCLITNASGIWTEGPPMHIAFVRTATQLRGYVDGVLTTTVAAGAIALPDQTGEAFNVARETSRRGILSVRVTKGEALYSSNFTPPSIEDLGP